MRGIVYVGGFSNSDVLGAAQGWYLSIVNNKNVITKLQEFYKRTDTFSLGVCNGCQLMLKLNIFSNNTKSTVKLVENKSKKFESRFVNVKITNNNNIFFKNMGSMNFGIHVAHHYGRFIDTKYLYNNQKVLHYCYNDNNTEKYPFNPNRF